MTSFTTENTCWPRFPGPGERATVVKPDFDQHATGIVHVLQNDTRATFCARYSFGLLPPSLISPMSFARRHGSRLSSMCIGDGFRSPREFTLAVTFKKLPSRNSHARSCLASATAT
jgi:hypothetical protein